MSNILTRWRLVLGGEAADGTQAQLSDQETFMDEALSALYDFDGRGGKFKYAPGAKGPGGSDSGAPNVARWLGDIRQYFPQEVAEVMQHDALNKPALKEKLMLEPEILEQASPDVHLVATLLELGKLIPERTKDTARIVVRKVVDELLKRLEQKTMAAITGAINRSVRNRRPKHNEIDWHSTIQKNLKHYQADYRTIIPEVLIGYGKKTRRALKDVVLCLDQSGSMGTSVVYSGIFGSVMASLPNVKTQMVVFDTRVADLTEDLKDPVDLLFGVQLGGGTDINLALGYCQGIIARPADTILVLITDLYEGGDQNQMRQRMAEIVATGIQLVVLLALNDDGSPSYDRGNAQFLATLGVPVFGCTPDQFPDLMAAAIAQQDLMQWAGENKIALKGRATS